MLWLRKFIDAVHWLSAFATPFSSAVPPRRQNSITTLITIFPYIDWACLENDIRDLPPRHNPPRQIPRSHQNSILQPPTPNPLSFDIQLTLRKLKSRLSYSMHLPQMLSQMIFSRKSVRRRFVAPHKMTDMISHTVMHSLMAVKFVSSLIRCSAPRYRAIITSSVPTLQN